ncbi:phenylalanine--tRNA ligase subunit alpha [archaeon]|nr:phenylalanine--tRNA ligase subunit alpha [archaeon]
MYRLTEEGQRYLERGLPERRLLEILESPLEIKEASVKLEDFNIAMQWAKKEGWVEAKEGMLHLIEKPGEFQVEEALKKVLKKDELDGDIAEVLLSRKLIEEIRDDIMQRAKKLVGTEITELPEELISTGLWREVKFKPYNVESPGKQIHPGKRQPYQRFISSMKRKLVELGFVEVTGPAIETEFWNFDALFQPQNHPARDWTSTYQLKHPKHGKLPDEKIVEQVSATHQDGWTTGSTGWKYRWDPEIAARLMPRAHGTCLSARTLASGPDIPGKYFGIARCYRPDFLDATHLIEFNQAEGIVIGEDLNLKNLLGILEIFAREIAGAEEVKFLPDYYPFTEPSVQLSAKHPELGWIEFGGSGIFREELTKPLGIDVPVLAWGIGIDRLAMFKLGINDIRYLFAKDLAWLRESKVV